ncbi:hypothetical protein ZWY2020_056870 [Hordeum vulgare]|nr:hypothetical protein ZWY2020_056870 [Hordeum vulgare]
MSLATTSSRGSIASWLLYRLCVIGPPPCSLTSFLRGPPWLNTDEDGWDHCHCLLHPTTIAMPPLHYADVKFDETNGLQVEQLSDDVGDREPSEAINF